MNSLRILVAVALGTAPAAAKGAMGLDVRGTDDCPSAQSIRVRYAELAPTAATGWQGGTPDAAHVFLMEGLLEVSLWSGFGVLIGQRSVEAPPRCDDRADIAAALLAAWSTKQETAVALAFPEPESSIVESNSTTNAETVVDNPWRGGVAAALAVLAPLQGDPVAPAVGVEASIGRAQSRLRALVALGASGERTVALGSGAASWRIAALRLGTSARLLGSDDGWLLRGVAGAGVTMVDARGSGFATVQTSRHFAPEIWGGVRVAVPAQGFIQPFAAACIGARLQTQDLIAENPTSHHQLPAGELELTLGAQVFLPTRASRPPAVPTGEGR